MELLLNDIKKAHIFAGFSRHGVIRPQKPQQIMIPAYMQLTHPNRMTELFQTRANENLWRNVFVLIFAHPCTSATPIRSLSTMNKIHSFTLYFGEHLLCESFSCLCEIQHSLLEKTCFICHIPRILFVFCWSRLHLQYVGTVVG